MVHVRDVSTNMKLKFDGDMSLWLDLSPTDKEKLILRQYRFKNFSRL